MKVARLAILAALCLSISHAVETRPRPVEAFISPPQLFPSEGSPRAPYAPLPAFDRPSGKTIGQVVADLSPCPAGDDGYACGAPRAWYLKLAGGRRIELYHQMVGYDQESLVTYRPVLRLSGKAWSEVEYEDGKFWIQTPSRETDDYESLANWAEDLDTWCSHPGKCAALPTTMRKEIERVVAGKYELESISQQPYRIDGIVKQGSRRYYKVTLYKPVRGAGPALPKAGYIPTRRKDGSHVGQFSPKGC
ncbi:hypothetical protein SAMN05428959_101260 [Duganella sp. CF517]|uniref:hypothetical protein n=1 Tax=Duganella sp. CF517 TaxID=1881038 RepID=UPI0008CCDAE3|nr:hypothetical protein [Duganella sp. CF517]SEN11557.1 hypothetical protein SAMN05428959_101260 [Duganella sp. CF517]